MLLCSRRALIPGTSIKPLDTNLKTLSLKRTVSFVKATKELARHQELMQHVSATTHEAEDNDNLSGGDNDVDDEQVNLTQDLPFWPYWSDSGVDDEQVSLTQDLPFCPYWSDSGVDEQVSLTQDLPFCVYWSDSGVDDEQVNLTQLMMDS